VPELSEILRKRYFRTNEVCQLTDTQPYVLRFWESEFPQLKPERARGGQPVYRRTDIDLVLRIKQLLYDEEYTIEGARKRLEQELSGEIEPTVPAERASFPAELADSPVERQAQPARPPLIEIAETGEEADPADAMDGVSRERYDDALEEIAHLRLKLQEAETSQRKAENRVQKAEAIADRHRRRVHNALTRLEKLLETLS
jgi:DNA-binding transcriptional MerR regulator